MEDISLHILDVAENAVRAGATRIAVTIHEDRARDELMIRIEDDGQGMDAVTAEKARHGFFTTKPGKKFGLGLALLRQSAQETGGDLQVVSAPKQGTVITAVFKQGHPDMRPLGDVLETMSALIVGNPALRFQCDFKYGNSEFLFDTNNV